MEYFELNRSMYPSIVNNHLFQLINYACKEAIENIIKEIPLDTSLLTVKGSCGKGDWNKTPWIAIYNKKITTTVKKGVFIFIVFSQDMERVYFTLNQGIDKLKDKGEVLSKSEKLKITRNKIREKYKAEGFRTDNNIVIGNKYYEEGAIFYKEYKKDNLPYEAQIKADLEILLHVYQQCYNDTIDCQDKDKLSNVLDVKSIIESIRIQIRLKGFYYSYEDIGNMYLSLKTNHFLIIEGINGIGKSNMVKYFAEAFGAYIKNGQFSLIPVQPDWSNSFDLIGYKDLKGDFIPGILMKVVKKATENKDKAYFICLDEMNLAKVECYLSNFISAAEIREFDNGEYKTAPLLEKGFLPKENEYSELSIPDNLYLIGTVNISDSTVALNEKVIDRANIIELTEVNFEYDDYIGEPVNSMILDNDFLKKSFRTNDDAMKLNKDYVKLISKKCTEINSILMPFNKHFAYRAKFDIVSYTLENKISGIFDEDTAFDYQIAQRILPKIELDGIKRKDLLIALYDYCAGGVKLNTNGDYILEVKQNLNKAKYKKSAAKIIKMLEGGRHGLY